MLNPFETDEINVAIADTEDAIHEFTELERDGTLGDLPVDDAVSLIDRASRSTQVAANAFGIDHTPNMNADELYGAMFTAYSEASAYNSIRDSIEYMNAESDAKVLDHRDAIVRSLGLTDMDTQRMDSDARGGDFFSWSRAEEDYMFG